MDADNDLYFSERERGIAPATEPKLSNAFWRGFASLIRTLTKDGSFAQDYPKHCFEHPVPVDCDYKALCDALDAEIPGFSWPRDGDEPPDTLVALDAVEFFARHVSRVASREYHSYGTHHHLIAFDREGGFLKYVASVNRLFRRNGHPYELEADGKVRRTVPEVLRDVLETELRTGEAELDRLISSAIERFRNPELEVRKEALERLWDAWERAKTLLDADKKRGAQRLVESAVPCPALRERIEREARSLTEIGNQFRIRHSETDKIPIERDVDVDYLFHRLYALLRLLLTGVKLS